MLNLGLVGASYLLSRIAPGSARAWGCPPELIIEPTSHCNLRCPLCPSGNKTLQRKAGFMDMGLYRKIIDDVRGKACNVLLYGLGESFLHKEFLEMIRYARDAGLYTSLSTNGHYLSDPDALIDSGLDSLILSIDGVTQETYSQYRVGGDLAKVMEGTRALEDAKLRRGSKTPYTRLQFILFRHNEHEVEEAHRLAKELGVDRMVAKTAEIPEDDGMAEFLPDGEEHRRYDESAESFALKGEIRDRCQILFHRPMITWEGELLPCCYDVEGDFRWGKLGNGTTLPRVWTNYRANRFRKKIFADRMSAGICQRCGEGMKLHK